VDSVRFAILKSKDRSSTPLDHEVKYSKKYDSALTANQNSYIHIQFTLKSDAPKANFVGARLVNPKYPTATGTIAAVQNRDANDYYIVIDLGDPDHILPYNDDYELELIIGSEHIHNNINWRFAKAHVSFVKPATKPPKNDGSYETLPEIQHMFPADRKQPNRMITLAFVGVVGVACLIFFYLLGKIRRNQDPEGRFPTDFFGSITQLLFLAALLGVLGTLVLFWIKINLFETLSILALSIIPLVFIGNRALASIDKN